MPLSDFISDVYATTKLFSIVNMTYAIYLVVLGLRGVLCAIIVLT